MGITNEKNFKIIKKLGEGGFGEVYLIEKENKLYALKKTKHALNEEEMNQYNKIISILKNINNIYVTKYYYTFTEKNSFNIIMDNKTTLNINFKEYKINEVIGRGGFGIVYKLEKNNEYFAFKKILIIYLTKEEVDKFVEEARILILI